ncbi:hypothetical protein, partial [Kribbella sp.]|uniref:hypothetical protein n=1 Tax=Kribbella sp. TaxID=1871183 RepID=UPI002D5B2C29
RPGELPTRLAVAAVEQTDVPLLSPAHEGTDTAARAGLLAAIPTGWLAVVGAQPAHDIYTETAGTVLTADQTLTGWDTTTTGEPIQNPSAPGAVLSYDPAVVPSTISSGTSVESVLFRLAAAEDVPGFRKLAAELGDWVTESRVVLRWDDVVYDGESFAHGVSGWVAQDCVKKEDLLAAAWYRFHERLVGQQRRHPWPPWMVGDDLVSAWLGMSGVEAPEQTQATSPDTPPAASAQVARGKEIAQALDEVLGTRTGVVDVRTAVAEAEAAKHELFELKGHVYGLERTLGFRNKAMKTRENRIRELRIQVQKLTAAHERIRGSRTYAVSRVMFHAAQVRKPKVVARKLVRRIRNR